MNPNSPSREELCKCNPPSKCPSCVFLNHVHICGCPCRYPFQPAEPTQPGQAQKTWANRLNDVLYPSKFPTPQEAWKEEYKGERRFYCRNENCKQRDYWYGYQKDAVCFKCNSKDVGWYRIDSTIIVSTSSLEATRIAAIKECIEKVKQQLDAAIFDDRPNLYREGLRIALVTVHGMLPKE